MVVARAEANQQDAREKHRIGPALPRVDKYRAASQQPPQTGASGQQKCRVGGDIEKIGNAKESALVGKIVIPLGLGDGRHARHRQHYDEGEQRDGEHS